MRRLRPVRLELARVRAARDLERARTEGSEVLVRGEHELVVMAELGLVAVASGSPTSGRRGSWCRSRSRQ